MAEHLGYEHSDLSGLGNENLRTGTTATRVRTDVGEMLGGATNPPADFQ
jgi:hypothetical protein